MRLRGGIPATTAPLAVGWPLPLTCPFPEPGLPNRMIKLPDLPSSVRCARSCWHEVLGSRSCAFRNAGLRRRGATTMTSGREPKPGERRHRRRPGSAAGSPHRSSLVRSRSQRTQQSRCECRRAHEQQGGVPGGPPYERHDAVNGHGCAARRQRNLARIGHGCLAGCPMRNASWTAFTATREVPKVRQRGDSRNQHSLRARYIFARDDTLSMLR